MTLYAAYDDGLRVIDPDAAEISTRLQNRRVDCVAISPTAPDRVFAGTVGDGLYRLTDGGNTFENVAITSHEPDSNERDNKKPNSTSQSTDRNRSSDSRSLNVTAVALHPHDPETVWVGTEPSRVYRSVDGGETFDPVSGLTAVPSADAWSFPPRPDTHHVRWIEPCPADPDRWFVGIEAGALVVTPDNGETWIDRPPGSRRDTHTMATHVDVPDRVHTAAGDGYAQSDDRGQTWELPMDGLDHGYVWGLAIDPDDPETVVVSAATGAMAAHRSGDAVVYRRDGSDRWERLSGHEATPDGGTDRAALASDTWSGSGASAAIWLLHDRGLFVTTTGGDTFERIDVSLPTEPPLALATDGRDGY